MKRLLQIFVIIFILALNLTLKADEDTTDTTVVRGAEGFGFKAKLLDYPSFVSPYDEREDRFSAALIPRTHVTLSNRLKRTPRVRDASFQDSSLTFNTVYNQVRTEKYELIPVSVNTLNYFKYRTQKNDQESFDKSVEKLLFDPKRQNARKGLGVNIGLPKRLDKIFGEGGADLRVSGFRKIIFSGRSSWNDAATTDVYKQSKFPSLSMEQVSRIDIQGTIGSKITVKVSQDSQTDIPLANRIQLRYKGDDDDILKVIEAGNTNLSLPNTKFVGYSQKIQGLFGLKAEAQVGSLRLIGIASQEKGTSESSSITATGEEMATYKRDYNYAEGRIYDLGDSTLFDDGDEVVLLKVFEQEKKAENLEADTCNLYVNPNDTSDITEANREIRMVDLESSQYTLIPQCTGTEMPYVYFTSARGISKAIGVYMKVKDKSGNVRTIGNIDEHPFILKTLRPIQADVTPTHSTWKLMWRNIYDVPKGLDDVDDLNLKIFAGSANMEGNASHLDYQEGDNETHTFLEILGLDQKNTTGATVPDGKLDANDAFYRKDWGLLIFPNREPFACDTFYGEAPVLKEQVPNIYSYTSPNDQTQGSKYYLQVMSTSRSSKIRLGRANIIEGSERVYLNGNLLKSGVDYTVNYDFGQLTLTTEEASDPNADIKIDFEYAPFFAMQKKTLVGLRGEYEWSENLKIGSTFLYKTDKAQERKPRVGEETAKMMVYGR